MASADQISCRNLGRPSWASAPTGRRGGSRSHPGQRRTAERLRQRMGGTRRNRSRDHPQRGHQPRAIPQSRLRRASSLCTREPLGTGDADRRVGPAGLLAMAMVFCHSEERSDVGIRPIYDGRGFGPPHERRGDGQVVVPGGGRGKAAGLTGGFAGKIRLGENFGGFFLLWGAKYPGKALQSQKKYDILAS